jgi:hypothetical protein
VPSSKKDGRVSESTHCDSNLLASVGVSPIGRMDRIVRMTKARFGEQKSYHKKMSLNCPQPRYAGTQHG